MYKASIIEASKEFTPKERIAIKDTSNGIQLDAELEGDATLLITPKAWAIIEIENDKAKEKKYTKYVVIDSANNTYVTGSESFWRAFRDIYDEMSEYPDEEYQIEVCRKPSKNYSGKYFITCSIV